MFALTQSDAMNSVISTLQQGEHSTSVFYLSLLFHLPDKAAVTDAQNKMPWTPESERIRHSDGAETQDGSSPCSIL